MNYIDISWPIEQGMVEYKDKKVFNIVHAKNCAEHGVNQTEITLSAHAGTHLDAPYHMLAQGKKSESIKPLIGSCTVLDLTHVTSAITAEHLHDVDIQEHDIILLKTTNSFLSTTGSFKYDFVYLDRSGAQYLADKKVQAVGIDYLGIERNQDGHPTHKILLGAEIYIIEGLRLEHVSAQQKYGLLCLPLSIVGTDAALARVLLITK